MATEIIKSIKPAGGGDYTSLASWNTDRAGDIVVRDTIEIAEIYGGGSVGAIAMDNTWVTDVDHTIQIRAATGHAHEGMFDPSKAYIISGDFAIVDIFNVGYVTVGPGISIEDDNAETCNYILDIRAPQPITFDGLIIRVNNPSVLNALFSESDSAGFTHVFKNGVIYDDPTAGLGGQAIMAASAVTNRLAVYNSVIISQGVGGFACLRKAASAIFTSQNNYLFTTGPDHYEGVIPGTNDATSNSESLFFPNEPHDSTTFINVTFAAADYHLAEFSGLKDNGFNLTAQGVTTDFEVQSRVIPFDIGADKFTAGTPEVKSLALLLGSW